MTELNLLMLTYHNVRYLLKSADDVIQFHIVRTADLGICALVDISDRITKNIYILLFFI